MWKSLSSESDIVFEVVTERLNADRGEMYGTGDRTSGGRWKVAALRESPGFLDEPVQRDCLRRICFEQVATRGLGDRETVLIPIKLRQMLRMRFSNYRLRPTGVRRSSRCAIVMWWIARDVVVDVVFLFLAS